ncbi:MAG: tripartite tricarboxylate transporter TctB family protein [Pelagimonas sp.]|uniref:tripartite tricarboxylate transporter TctB family protein n=1 Tax=Pelagimonas sp. TaxID=2073170 RepID=UPI003D6B3DCA
MQFKDQVPSSIAQRAVSGVVLLAVGLGMLLVAWGYPVGTLKQMGPGYIPRVIGVLISCLALAILVSDLKAPNDDPPGGMHWRGLIFISAAITLFAFLVDVAGLVPSMFLAAAVSMFADDRARPVPVLIYATLATAVGWVLFLVALELPIPAFWR